MKKYREITPRQLQEGYLVLEGNPMKELAIARHHKYMIVSRTDRGTYIVEDPEEQEEE